MKTDTLRKIIIALIVVLVVSLVLAIALSIAMSKSGTSNDTTPPETSPAAVTDPPVTDAPDTRAPETTPGGDVSVVTEPPVTEPPVTRAPVTAPPTTDPPETAPSAVSAPVGFTFTHTAATDTGVKLDLRAVCEGKRQNDGTVALTVTVYLDHRSLYMGGRKNCKISVGPYSDTFSTEPITRAEITPTSTKLFTLTGAFAYQDVVDLYVSVPVRVTYSDVKIEYLTIEESFSLQ